MVATLGRGAIQHRERALDVAHAFGRGVTAVGNAGQGRVNADTGRTMTPSANRPGGGF
ncbi:hypothetical protein MRS76_18685 [Rhizobiaceae bacterium n13]|uniref:hypothetical protein n=1 Tax=Ferirhizobium litorale TaxID=2927786 RepID=UPI0024B2BBC9|nr:hypothetical protein [Fererhizobium litorale]MDI7863977.1 hypothetical protein [Fererhizobium litorale]